MQKTRYLIVTVFLLVRLNLALAAQEPIYELSGKSTVCEVSEKYPGQNDNDDKPYFSYALGDSLFQITGKARFDGLYGVNLKLLNNANNNNTVELDRIASLRHILETWFLYAYGKESFGYDVVKFRLGIRNRGVWRFENSTLRTKGAAIKHVDAIIGFHNHSIPRYLFWARELWLEFALNEIFNCENKHSLTLGFFPFVVGRGIALGDVFEIDPQLLSDEPDLSIDQYAPGIKLSGELKSPCAINYDFYFEIAENNADTFELVNQPIYSQRFGRKHNPARGFGSFEYILAGRFLFKFKNKTTDVVIEPYGVYSFTAEQTAIFPAQVSARLGTVGLATELEHGNWEGGFDTAFNMGFANVFGWDNNFISERNENGFDQFFFTRIVSQNPNVNRNPPEVVANEQTKQVVNNDHKIGQQFNGKKIGQATIDGQKTSLFNANNRFSNPFKVSFKGGAMFVGDIAYKFIANDLKLAVTGGFATGDKDAFLSLIQKKVHTSDVTYSGFIPRQELYQGRRVRSLIFLAGPGPIPRPLITTPDFISEQPNVLVRPFSNIILTGASMAKNIQCGSSKWALSTNVIGFWTYFTQSVQIDSHKPFNAGRYYGTEWNLLLSTDILEDLKFFANGAVFFPGSFYTSLKGIPFDPDRSGFVFNSLELKKDERIPRLGNDPAYFINIGFEYKF